MDVDGLGCHGYGVALVLSGLLVARRHQGEEIVRSPVWETGVMTDRPAPSPAKILAQWMDWENGTETPGRVMANLKTAGLRDLLESLVAAEQPS